jgi:D-tyrosyl-tRNA(Tyr) deacylase
MRAVIQRVALSQVVVAGAVAASIGRGLLVLLGVADGDDPADAEHLAGRIARLRIFPDGQGRMNLSVLDLPGEVLVVSQFTLLAEFSGNRPSFTPAARPELAEPLYQAVVARLAQLLGRPVPTGVFGAAMQVQLVNDGPVTIVMDTRRRERAGSGDAAIGLQR